MDSGWITGIVTCGSVLITLLAFLLYFVSEDRRRNEAIGSYQQSLGMATKRLEDAHFDFKERISRWEISAKELLTNSETLMREIQDIRSAVQEVRPNFTTFITNQWRVFDRMSRYRHQKLKICQQIVGKHLQPGDNILLDSGSTVDQVTAELISRPVSNISIYSNNILAAAHLTGTSLIRFTLFQGEFFQRSWAVYSQEANQRMDQFGISVVIIAAAVFRANSGVMVREKEEGNYLFKRRALEIFRQKEESRLIIAIDASKFYENTNNHRSVFTQTEWKSLLTKAATRVTLVTSSVPRDATRPNRNSFEEQIAQLRGEKVNVVVVDVSDA
jgi:DeoR/GlpR family transcriptional regulator of sugar metabolism